MNSIFIIIYFPFLLNQEILFTSVSCFPNGINDPDMLDFADKYFHTGPYRDKPLKDNTGTSKKPIPEFIKKHWPLNPDNHQNTLKGSVPELTKEQLPLDPNRKFEEPPVELNKNNSKKPDDNDSNFENNQLPAIFNDPSNSEQKISSPEPLERTNYGKEPPYPKKIDPYSGEVLFPNLLLDDIFHPNEKPPIEQRNEPEKPEKPFVKQEKLPSEEKKQTFQVPVTDPEIAVSKPIIELPSTDRVTEKSNLKLPEALQKSSKKPEPAQQNSTPNVENFASKETENNNKEAEYLEIPILLPQPNSNYKVEMPNVTSKFWGWFKIKWIPIGDLLFPGYLRYLFQNPNFVSGRFGLIWKPLFSFICPFFVCQQIFGTEAKN